jgi:hypothetical protein
MFSGHGHGHGQEHEYYMLNHNEVNIPDEVPLDVTAPASLYDYTYDAYR